MVILSKCPLASPPRANGHKKEETEASSFGMRLPGSGAGIATMVARMIDTTLLLALNQPVLQLVDESSLTLFCFISPVVLLNLSDSLIHSLLNLFLKSLSANDHNVFLLNIFICHRQGITFLPQAV